MVKLAAARRYEAAWDLYRSGDFHQALGELTGFEAEFGPDPAVVRLRETCEAYRQCPPENRLGRNFKDVDKMRRRLKKSCGPAGREEGHGKDWDTGKTAWLLLAWLLLFSPAVMASDPATLTVTKAQHGREIALKVGSILRNRASRDKPAPAIAGWNRRPAPPTSNS